MFKRVRAFTLIETLVVVGIIAILAALFFPVIARARAKARQTSCAMNIRHITMAVSMYTADNSETMPCAFFGQFDSTRGYTWRYAIWSDTNSVNAWVCPQAPELKTWRPSMDPVQIPIFGQGDPPPIIGYHITTIDFRGAAAYAANRVHYFTGGPTPPFANPDDGGPVALSKASNPSSTILLTELTGAFAYNYGTNRHDLNPGIGNPFAKRHTGGANYAWMDGHVTWRDPASVACGTGGGVDNCPWSVE